MSKRQVETGFAEVQGARLHYEVAGQGHPLLLLHAGVADSGMWNDQFYRFAQSYTVIRCDLPGFGKSEFLPGRVARHDYVAGLLQFLGIPRAHVVGSSYGGRIAIDFTLARPGMVGALVLVAPAVSGSPPSEEMQRFATAEDETLERGDLAAATELNLQMWVDGPYRSREQVNPGVRERVREMQFHAFTIPMPEGVELQPLTPPAITRLSEIQVPTLVIVGDLDVQHFRTLAERLAVEIPDAQQLLIIPGVAHMVNMEQPDTFTRVVLDFLDKQ